MQYQKTEPSNQHFCPHCGTPTTWKDNLYRPFCGSRCKLIDLGAWANEDYVITEQTPDFNLDEQSLNEHALNKHGDNP